MLEMAAAEHVGRSGRRMCRPEPPREPRAERPVRLTSANSSPPRRWTSRPRTPRPFKVKDRSDWKYIGNEAAFTPDAYVDLVDMTTGGGTQFGADVILDGMKTAVVARSPVYRGNGRELRRLGRDGHHGRPWHG